MSAELCQVLKDLGAENKSISLHVETSSGPDTITGILTKITDAGLVMACDGGIRYFRCSQILSFEISRDHQATAAPAPFHAAEPHVSKAEDPIGQAVLPSAPADVLPTTAGSGAEAETSSSAAVESTGVDESEFEVFSGVPDLPLPAPSFTFPDLGKNEQQELNRWLNRYNYAKKVREIQRMREDIPSIERLADSLQDARLYLLAGLLANESGDSGKLRVCFERALSLKSLPAAMAYAAIQFQKREYGEAAELLVWALQQECKPAEQNLFVSSLGRILKLMPDRELRGAATIRDAVRQSAVAKDADRVIALCLSVKYPDAARAALAGDFDLAQKLAQDSFVFYPPENRDWMTPPRAQVPPVTHFSSDREWQQRLFGRVSAYYVDRAYGFLVDDIRQKIYFFREADVSHDSLIDALQAGQVGQQVTFTPAPRLSATSSYDRGLGIQLAISPGTNGEAPVNEVPTHRSRLNWGLPKGTSHYARAKRAERDGNLTEAKVQYESEIQVRGEYLESAIKDLASLLMRLGDVDGAISSLQNNRRLITDTQRLDNMRANFYMQAHRFADAAQIFAVLRKKSGNKKQKLTFGRQEVLCYYASDSLEKALELVDQLCKEYSRDSQLRRLLERIHQKQQGKPALDDDLLGSSLRLAGLQYGLSPFARFALDNCPFAGLDERSKAREFFEEKDFSTLDGLVDEKIRGRRPKEKAALLLSLSAMCELQPDVAGDRDMRSYLRRYFTNMAEASIHDGLHADISRAYVAESLLLSPSLEGRTQPISLLLATYLPQKPDPGELNAPIAQVLKKLLADTSCWKRFIEDFSYFGCMSASLVVVLEKELRKEKLIQECSELSRDIESLRQKEHERCRSEKNQIEALMKASASIGYFQDLARVLLGAAAATRFDLDKQRLIHSAQLASDAAACWTEKDIIEREAKHARLDHALSSLQETIARGPTKLSIEVLMPLCHRIQNELNKYISESRQSATPQIELSNVLSNEYCILDGDGYLRVSLDLISKAGGAPVEGIDLQAIEEAGLTSIGPVHSPEVLRGGDQRELELKVRPSAAQIADEVFTLNILVRYHNRYGNSQEQSVHRVPVRIGKPDSFQEIPNPYAAYSGGTVVNNPEMFFGRQELISRMIKEVTQGENGQCFVLYGQKRSGKSSVLAQVQKRLDQPNFPISVTVGTIDTGNAEYNFSQTCIDELEDNLTIVIGKSPDRWPTREDIATSPIDSFRRATKLTCSILESHGWANPRIVLLVDEFTYLFEYIREGMISPHFMRNWKALLEKRLFNAVVVGQDSMPKFKQSFPNEFGVTHDERLTYLSDDDAMQLAQVPISIEGESRYRGRSLQRLLELSAGSPFYLQIMCDHLVRHLNRKRAPFITEADIETVLRELTCESGYLSEDKFDPLITAAGESVAEASREQYLETLSAISYFSSLRAGAPQRELAHLKDVQLLIRDMRDREVVSLDAAGRVSIKVGLFAAWLRHNRPYTPKSSPELVIA